LVDILSGGSVPIFMPGRPRIIAPNFPHHVVARSNRGVTIFHEREDYFHFLNMTAALKKRRDIKIWAFCIMSNHVHFLIVPQSKEDMVKYLQGLLVCYTQYYNDKYETEGQLWKAKYFSSVVDHENYLWQVLRYIERNPVRANLTQNPEDYPYSSASKNGIGSHFLDPLPFTPETLRLYKEWRSLPEPPEVLEFLRKSIRKNLPTGDKTFCKKLGYCSRPRGRPKKK